MGLIPGIYSPQKTHERFVMDILTYMCIFLEVLNVWWGFLISKMVASFVFKGRTKDVQEKIE